MRDDEGEPVPQDDTAAKLETAAKLMSLLYALVSLLWLLWILIPEHKRRLAAMRMVKAIERSAWRTAFRAGHQEMGLELSGCATSYQVPYLLSRVAGKAGQAYEKLRYTA